MMAVFENRLDWTAYFIVLAAFFDFLDGTVARLLNVKSEFGKQLDSLADMISFGLLPGVILFFLFLESQPQIVVTINSINIIPYLAFLIPVFSALRLAKFNVDPRQTEIFLGLPTPANTLLIVSFSLIHLNIFCDYSFLTSLSSNSYFLLGLTFVSCFLLIAEFPLHSLKLKSLKLRDNKPQFILMIVAIVMIAIFKVVAVPIVLLFYIVLSIVIKPK
tara:strand:+ start:238 stop:891 length:654 start_codon:yes stop_codon:yes gene_type:complete